MWLLEKLLAFDCYKAMENPFVSKDWHLVYGPHTEHLYPAVVGNRN